MAPFFQSSNQTESNRFNTLFYKLQVLFEDRKELFYALFLGGSLLTWFTLLRSVEPSQMTDIGLVSILPTFCYIILLALIGSFLWTLHTNPYARRILTGHLFTLIFFIHATPTVLYQTLRYSWAWKHVGVIEFILRNQKVDRYSQFLDAYHNWPGFFVLNAFFTESAGLELPLNFAVWAPLFFGLTNAVLVYLLADSLSYIERLKWMATFVFILTNWIGQDYFAPQAIAFFQHLLLIVCVLRWFRPTTALGAQPYRPISTDPIKRGWQIFQTIFKQDLEVKVPTEVSKLFSLKALFILVLYTNIAASHQLTPIMALLVVGLLVVTRRCSWVSLPVFMFVILLAWNTLFAGPFFFAHILGELEDFGKLASNAEETLKDIGQVSDGQRLVARLGRYLTLAVGALAMLGGLRRLFNRFFDITIVILIVAPIGLVAGGSYGGEVLFRVYLFVIPFLSILVGALFYPTSDHGYKFSTFLSAMLVSCLLLTGFLFAYFGKDKQYYFSPDEISAAEYLYSTAPPNSLLVEGSKNYPSQFTNYENFFYVPISREKPDVIDEILENPVAEMSRWMSSDRFAAAYLFITTSQKAEVEALGIMPKGALDQFEQELMASGLFEIEFDSRDAKIYRLIEEADEEEDNG